MAENSGTVVFPGKHVDAFGLQDAVVLLQRIINKDLVGALPHLPFAVEFEAATERVDLIIVATGRVPAPSLKRIIAGVVNIVPLWYDVFNVH